MKVTLGGVVDTVKNRVIEQVARGLLKSMEYIEIPAQDQLIVLTKAIEIVEAESGISDDPNLPLLPIKHD